MFIGDVGQGTWEEIDFQPASSGGGENYGWRLMEGNACFDPETGCPFPDMPPETCNDGSLIAPIIECRHREGGCGGLVTGGDVCRGPDYPDLDGAYFYADFCTGKIWAAVERGAVSAATYALGEPLSPVRLLGQGRLVIQARERPLPGAGHDRSRFRVLIKELVHDGPSGVRDRHQDVGPPFAELVTGRSSVKDR